MNSLSLAVHLTMMITLKINLITNLMFCLSRKTYWSRILFVSAL